MFRVRKVAVALLLSLLFSCGGGSTSSEGTPSNSTLGTNTGSLSVVLGTGTVNRGIRAQQAGFLVRIEVLDPITQIRVYPVTEVELDPTVPTQTVVVDGILEGTYLFRVSVFNLESEPVFTAQQAGTIRPGQVTRVTFNNTASPTPSPSPTPPATPTQLAFLTQPANGQAGQVLNNIQVVILDSNGVLVPTATNVVTLTLQSNPGPSTLGGNPVLTAGNGVALFNDLTLSKSGIGYTLAANSPGLTGVVSASFDISLPQGALTPLAGSPFTPAGLAQPTRATTDLNGNFLYVANFQFLGPNSVQGFAIDGVTGNLTPTPNSPYTAQSQPVATILSPDNMFLYVSNANPGANSISRFALNPGTGELTSLGPATPSGGGNPLDGQVRPGTPPFLFLVNFSTNSVAGFDATGGTLTPVPGSPVTLTGTPFNPSSVRVHPNVTVAYTNNGVILSVNPTTGALAQIGNFAPGGVIELNSAGTRLYTGGVNQIQVFDLAVPTNPVPIAGSPFAIPEDAIEIRLSADESTLYTTNQAGPNIRIFSVDPTTGAPTEVDDSPVVTTAPSLFTTIIDPQNRFLYVTDPTGNAIHGFSLTP